MPCTHFVSLWRWACSRGLLLSQLEYPGLRLINYIDTKTKCRHLKRWLVKGLCDRCLSEFIDWRYSQSCWYFRPCFVNCCPSNLLSGSTQPPSPLHCVWLGGGGGWWVLLDRRLTLSIWPDSEPTKLLDHSQTNPRRGEGPQTDKHLPQSPCTGKFF
jgi:hypothetical protein